MLLSHERSSDVGKRRIEESGEIDARAAKTEAEAEACLDVLCHDTIFAHLAFQVSTC